MKFCGKFHGSIEIKVVSFGLLFFFAVLNGVKSDCNYYEEIKAGETYYAFNPHYPNPEQGETHCTWRIKSLYPTEINCTIDISASGNCAQNSISVQFDGQQENRYCGNGTFILEGINPIIMFNLEGFSTRGKFLCSIVTYPEENEYNCKCGWKNPTRIVGGNETGINEYTMMSGLVDIRNEIIYCGATIISHKHVLTAAHCLENREINKIGVIVGEHDVTRGGETNVTRLYRVRDCILHPQYRDNNDIAICEIDGIIEYSAEVGPVCLPFQHPCDSFSGDHVTILGWGLTGFADAKAITLQEVSVSVTSSAECKLYYPKATSSNMCTYAKGKDACQMDSGGPVLWQDPTTRNLVEVGIVGGGIGCGGDEPAVHTRVGKYIEWIQSVTENVKYCKME